MAELLIGKNSVLEALKAKRPINKILLEKNRRCGALREIFELAREMRVTIQEVDTNVIDKACDGQRHQGILALVAPVEYTDIEAVLADSANRDTPAFLVILDEVQDPHNLGAIIRSCEAAGVNAVVISQRRCCPVTETVARSSAGAIEHLPVVRVGNLAQLVLRLKKQGFWIVGADMSGENLWRAETKFNFPVALIVGGENKGVGKLLRSECDLVYAVPMLGKVNSLNASVAAAIMVFEINRRRIS